MIQIIGVALIYYYIGLGFITTQFITIILAYCFGIGIIIGQLVVITLIYIIGIGVVLFIAGKIVQIFFFAFTVYRFLYEWFHPPKRRINMYNLELYERAERTGRTEIDELVENITSHMSDLNKSGDMFIKSKYDQRECPICLDDFEDDSVVSTLMCRHIFHISCIQRWFRGEQNEGRRSECPICLRKDGFAELHEFQQSRRVHIH
jgi:hypothetical protein